MKISNAENYARLGLFGMATLGIMFSVALAIYYMPGAWHRAQQAEKAGHVSSGNNWAYAVLIFAILAAALSLISRWKER